MFLPYVINVVANFTFFLANKTGVFHAYFYQFAGVSVLWLVNFIVLSLWNKQFFQLTVYFASETDVFFAEYAYVFIYKNHDIFSENELTIWNNVWSVISHNVFWAK